MKHSAFARAAAGLAVLVTVLGGFAGPARAFAAGPTYEQFVVKGGAECLEVTNRATAHAARVGASVCNGGNHQFWYFEYAEHAGGQDWYYIKVGHTRMCLNVDYFRQANGSPVVQASCSGGNNEKWHLWPGYDGYYWLVARHSGKCLERTGNTAVQWDCTYNWQQQWRRADTGIPVT